MKFRLVLLLFLGLNCLPTTNTLASQGPLSSTQEAAERDRQDERISPETLSKIALGSAVLGILLIAIPPLSFLGLTFGLLGFGLGIFTRKKVRKKLYSRLAIILGSLVLIYFLAALGLVAFY